MKTSMVLAGRLVLFGSLSGIIGVGGCGGSGPDGVDASGSGGAPGLGGGGSGGLATAGSDGATSSGGRGSGGATSSGGRGSGGSGTGGTDATGGAAGIGSGGGSGTGGTGTGGRGGTGGLAGSGGGGKGSGGRGTGGGAGGGSGQNGSGGSSTGGAGGSVVNAPWDWAGVIGTGQSLAVGQYGTPVKATTQPYHNLKMSTGTAAWPLDAGDSSFKMVALIEPIGRASTNYPSSYPTNIAGETPHTAMGDQITAMVMASAGRDYVNVHGEFGENGQCLTYLVKNAPQVGVNGHAYQGTLIETQAITRLAKAAGKTYGVAALTVTHGECDAGNTSYESQLYGLLTSYDTDIAALTGQTQKILMIVSQQNATNDRSASTLAQWKIGVDHPTDAVCSGPKYQYPYYTDGVHLVTDGYEQLGEKYGQVYYQRVVLGQSWQPLQPTSVDRTGTRVINVHYHVPVAPLVWDTALVAPNANSTAWHAGKGFEVRANNNAVTISQVAIAGDTVQITCASDLPTSGVVVGYAMTSQDGTTKSQSKDGSGNLLWNGALRWGQLRDSDPFVGATSKRAQPNYGVAFEMTVP
jgi:hypothetical protein